MRIPGNWPYLVGFLKCICINALTLFECEFPCYYIQWLLRKVDLHKYLSCLSSRTIIEEDTIYFLIFASIVGARILTNLGILFMVLPVKVVYTKVLPLLHVKRVKLLERDKNVHDKTRVINLWIVQYVTRLAFLREFTKQFIIML